MNQPLLTLLDHYEAAWPAERGTIQQIRMLVTNHANCFDRECLPGHVTGSALVLSADRRRVLLVHHRKLGRWLQPGGHADGDPDVRRVAQREVCEESGLPGVQSIGAPIPLDVDVHPIPKRCDVEGRVLEPAHEHHDIRFLLATDSTAPLTVTHESHDVRWCTPDEVHQLTQEESVLRLLHKAQAWIAV